MASDPAPASKEGLDVTITVVAQVPGLTAEEDAALLQALNLEGSPPAGRRIRLDGPASGGPRIVGLWDSDADYERFRDDRLMPALKGLGRALHVIEKRPATETVCVLPVTRLFGAPHTRRALPRRSSSSRTVTAVFAPIP
jgi:hypothetical protein